MTKLYEIVIFTAAAKDYADFILNYIDKDRGYIDHRLYRQHCQYDDGVYVKDLTRLGRDLTKTIIVDNIRDNFERQKDNGIEILTWLSDPTDKELHKLGVFLTKLHQSNVEDVREHLIAYNDSKWKSQYVSKRDFRTPEKRSHDRFSGTPIKTITPTKLRVCSDETSRKRLSSLEPSQDQIFQTFSFKKQSDSQTTLTRFDSNKQAFQSLRISQKNRT